MTDLWEEEEKQVVVCLPTRKAWPRGDGVWQIG
jgi:hypothetical protein